METRAASEPRGEATREALVRAAIDVFGRDGYSAATTKAIAREAKANQALISYHFGSKEGLYLAAVEHIVAGITRRMGPIAAEVEAEGRKLEQSPPSARRARSTYLDLLCRILEASIDVLTSAESAPWAKIIVREQQDPSAAFEIFYERVHRRLLDQMAGIVARLDGRRSISAEDRVTVLTIVGQVLVFRVARAAALRYMGRDALQPRDIGRIKKTLKRNVAAMLGVPLE